jgi:hypothetical protein
MAEQVELRPWEWEQIPAGCYAGEPGSAQKCSATDRDPHLRRFFGAVAAEIARSEPSPCLK